MKKRERKKAVLEKREWFREHIEGQIEKMHLALRRFTSNATTGLFPLILFVSMMIAVITDIGTDVA